MDNGNKVISLKNWREESEEDEIIQFQNGKCLINATISYIGMNFGLERIVRMFPEEEWMAAVNKVYKK